MSIEYIRGVKKPEDFDLISYYNFNIDEIIKLKYRLTNLINNVKPSQPIINIEPAIKVSADKKEFLKLIKEESNTNYGHTNVILQGDVVFPPRDENYVNYGRSGYGSYGYSGYMSGGDIFDKQAEILKKNVQPVPNQEKYFKLYRYGITTNEILHKPTDNNAPTLSLALFMPNDKIYTRKFADWMKRYCVNQMRLMLVFKYYFPEGNVRNYLDWYMLEEGFAKISGDDPSLIVTKSFDKFDCFDFEQDKIKDLPLFLASFYDKIKELENYKFNTGLDRIMTYFQMASSYINNNGVAVPSNNKGDFFVYKFSGPFIEQDKNGNWGHITNGYMGQEVRYISLTQQKYLWNDLLINRPVHLVWRDAHTNTLGYNDYLWIKNCFDVGNKYKLNYMLLPSSIEYEPVFNDKVKCLLDNKEYTRSAIAGIVQFMNFTDDNKFIPEVIYKQSVGMTFLLDINKQLPIKYHRPKVFSDYLKRILSDYDYGTDEYVNSSFFVLDYFRKRSLYFNHYFIWRIFGIWYRNIDKIEILLLRYLIKNNIITKSNITREEFIIALEKLRNDKTLINDNALKTLLSIYPNKYHISYTIFNTSDYNEFMKKEFNITEIMQNMINAQSPETHKYYDDVTEYNLQQLGFSCKNLITPAGSEWCVHPYQNLNISNNLNCSSANYYSGFYFENPPDFNIGILRTPFDIEKAVEILNDDTRIRLYKSNYKLTNDYTKWSINVDDENTGHIISKIQNLILYYTAIDPMLPYYIQQACVDINGPVAGTYSMIFCPLIWKALLYCGLDVPADWINYTYKTDDASQRAFNQLVIYLAKIPGWKEYATYILLTPEIKDVNFNNDFEDPNLQQLAVDTINRINTNQLTINDLVNRNSLEKYKLENINF